MTTTNVSNLGNMITKGVSASTLSSGIDTSKPVTQQGSLTLTSYDDTGTTSQSMTYTPDRLEFSTATTIGPVGPAVNGTDVMSKDAVDTAIATATGPSLPSANEPRGAIIRSSNTVLPTVGAWERGGATDVLLGEGTASLANGSVSGSVIIMPDNTVPRDATTTATNVVTIGKEAGKLAQDTGSVAIGYQAGMWNQDIDCVAIGQGAGAGNVTVGNNQTDGSVAIGRDAGNIKQSAGSIAIGKNAGSTTQDNGDIAIGLNAGLTSQTGALAPNANIAIGRNAAPQQTGGSVAIGDGAAGTGTAQGFGAVAVGLLSGINQGNGAVSVGGRTAAATAQGDSSISIGTDSGANQAQSCIAIGFGSGSTQTGDFGIAIGSNAGINQSSNAIISIGRDTGTTAQSEDDIAIGSSAGNDQSLTKNIAIGSSAGMIQTGSSIAIGSSAGVSQTANSVAIGTSAGATQIADSIAVGNNAGNNQGINAIAVGKSAGTTQGIDAIALGTNSGTDQSVGSCIAIGSSAGNVVQSRYDVAIGRLAGSNQVNERNIAIGNSCGSNQTGAGIAIGASCGLNQTGTDAIAIGSQAGATQQTQADIAIGRLAGINQINTNNIAIGNNVGGTQNGFCISMGFQASTQTQTSGSVSIGTNAGNNQTIAIAIGRDAGRTIQASNGIAIGVGSGDTQGVGAVAVGSSGITTQTQGVGSVSLGYIAGTIQADDAIAIGRNCATFGTQGAGAISIGKNCNTNGTAQGARSIAIGENAAQFGQNNECIALGYNASGSTQPANSFYIGATCIRTGITPGTANSLFYDSSNGEIYYDTVAGGSTGNWIFTGNDAGIATDLDLIQLATNLVTITGNLDAAAGLDVTGAVLTTAVGITNTAGEVLISDGNLQLNDDVILSLGTGDDLQIIHNETDTIVTSTTGNLLFDNINVTGSTQFDLGTDTSATTFEVRNDGGAIQFSVNGAGTGTIGKLEIDSLAASNLSLKTIGTISDFEIQNTTTNGNIRLKAPTGTSTLIYMQANEFVVTNDGSTLLYQVTANTVHNWRSSISGAGTTAYKFETDLAGSAVQALTIRGDGTVRIDNSDTYINRVYIANHVEAPSYGFPSDTDTGLFQHAGADTLSLRTNTQDRLTISSTGVVTIPNIPPGSDVQTDGTSNLIGVSDERLKNIHGPVQYGLQEIQKLEPILFNYKNDPEDTPSNIGFSAQNVAEVAGITEACPVNSDGYYGFNSRGILASLVNAVKELSSKVDELTARIQTLENP